MPLHLAFVMPSPSRITNTQNQHEEAKSKGGSEGVKGPEGGIEIEDAGSHKGHKEKVGRTHARCAHFHGSSSEPYLPTSTSLPVIAYEADRLSLLLLTLPVLPGLDCLMG